MTHVRRRFWFELSAAVVSALALLATLVWREWIELAFRVDPDGGSGTLEWLIVATAGVLAVGFASLVPLEWRRSAPAQR